MEVVIHDRLRGIDDPLATALVEHGYSLSPCHALWACVMLRALIDARVLERSAAIGSDVRQQTWRDAVSWLLSPRRTVGSAVWVAEVLGMDVRMLREEISRRRCSVCGVSVLEVYCECSRRSPREHEDPMVAPGSGDG